MLVNGHHPGESCVWLVVLQNRSFLYIYVGLTNLGLCFFYKTPHFSLQCMIHFPFERSLKVFCLDASSFLRFQPVLLSRSKHSFTTWSNINSVDLEHFLLNPPTLAHLSDCLLVTCTLKMSGLIQPNFWVKYGQTQPLTFLTQRLGLCIFDPKLS